MSQRDVIKNPSSRNECRPILANERRQGKFRPIGKDLGYTFIYDIAARYRFALSNPSRMMGLGDLSNN